MNIRPKELTAVGIHADTARSIAIALIRKHCKHYTKDQLLHELKAVVAHPEDYNQHPVWGLLANKLAPPQPMVQHYELRPEPLSYATYGSAGIDTLARQQMTMAMRLPVSAAGALMPDGHAGYGLPIGGVLATEGVVIPYAVGVDIGCRMQLTVLDAPAQFIDAHKGRVVEALMTATAFGMDGTLPVRHYHAMFDRDAFRDEPWLRQLRGKAIRQLGSSGRGNHFVDVCEVHLPAGNALGLSAGRYVGILSHSGSRALGTAIAEQFTTIAKQRCRLPRQAGPFAWLELDSSEGQAYWHYMQLAGEYAAACHDIIHEGVSRALRLQPLVVVSNHHNFAWRDTLPDGRQVVIHRKGATPAHRDELGIIPGSMLQPGYVVRGLGNPQSLYSASHGAGRQLSRLDARNTVSRHALSATLRTAGITLLGGSTEEAPQAYKDLEAVMQAQRSLVNVEGTIVPRVVRMSDYN
ncbi:MAG: RtcB family protein [Muribaculaceae bacterium]|nr:RtcB family protein [Muribaculaceae bacterium]